MIGTQVPLPDGRIITLPPITVGAMGHPGSGKCLAIGTPVLMYDGTVQAVEDIEQDDLLMGPDSLPRRVVDTNRGVGPLFRITPVKGEPYEVNEHHILSIKDSRHGSLAVPINISITDWFSATPSFREVAKGWRAGIEFSTSYALQPLVPPYLLGYWLGDGDSNRQFITSADPEIETYIEQYCRTNEFWFKKVPRKGTKASQLRIIRRGAFESNRLRDALCELGLIDNPKRIPIQYKCGPCETRLELLAGLLDSDGYLCNGCFEIVSKSAELASDILFLARSLGLAAYDNPRYAKCQTGAVGYYHRITISGDVSLIPTKIARKQWKKPREQIKDVLRTGITVDAIGDGEYAGFELTGDGLFLLGDFTVTHNSHLFASFPKPMLVLATDPMAKMQPYFERGKLDATVHRGQWDQPVRIVNSFKTGQPIIQIEGYYDTTPGRLAMQALMDRIEQVMQETRDGRWATVVLDSWSGFEDIALNRRRSGPFSVASTTGNHDGRAVYAAAKDDVKPVLINRLVHMNCNVGITFHISEKVLEDGGTVLYNVKCIGDLPSTIGQNLAERYRAEAMADGTTRRLLTRPDGRFNLTTLIDAPSPCANEYSALFENYIAKYQAAAMSAAAKPGVAAAAPQEEK